MDWRAALRVCEFFVPAEVLMAVLMVFALENVVDALFALFVPDGATAVAYAAIYLLAAAGFGAYNLLTADAEEIDELDADLDDVRE